MHLPRIQGSSWWSGGLDASGRPIAEAVAIFVPLFVLDILSCVFIPPSFLWSCLPSLALCRMTSSRSGIDRHQRNHRAGPCICRVCAFERSVNMEHKECCNPPLAPRIHCSPLPADGWFIRPIQNYRLHTHTHTHTHTHAHTHTTQLSDGCIPRPPAVPAAFDDVFNGFIHPKACSLFSTIFFFFHPPYPSLQAVATKHERVL